MQELGEIDSKTLSSREAYALLTSIVTPRPIAWVSTQNEEGLGNLAPFSYFQALCSNPPTIMLSVGWLRDGSMKHTLANILETKEFVVNHVSEKQGQAMLATAAQTEENEWELAQVASAPARRVNPPRVADSLAALECRLTHAIPLGQGPHGTPSSTVLFGEVLHFYTHPSLQRRDAQGRYAALAAQDLQSLGRLSGPNYCRSDAPFALNDIPKGSHRNPPKIR